MSEQQDIPADEFSILAFPTEEPDAVKLADRHWDQICKHISTTIDENRRELTCNSCGTVLDPVAWIVDWAKRTRIKRQSELAAVQARNEMCVHAIGLDGERSRCGAGASGRYTVTITNRVGHVTCKKCRKSIQGNARYLTTHDQERGEVLL